LNTKFDKEIAWRTALIPAILVLVTTGDPTELRTIAASAAAAGAGFVFDWIVYSIKKKLEAKRGQK
jgi:hypothetical protein